MAIYHLHHSTVGRSTHAPGTARAHARYITRPSACSAIVGSQPAEVPLEREPLLGWLSKCEREDRVNARVIDKVCLALPIELNQEEGLHLVRDFVDSISGGRVRWFAAIHDRGEDAANPHAHVVIRDRAIDSGKRVLNTSERGSTERLRRAWELSVNAALECAGSNARVSRESNAARGIEDVPTVHLGPAEHIQARGLETRRGSINQKARAANQALQDARRIVREAEQTLRKLRPPNTITGADITPSVGVPGWLRAREDMLTTEYGKQFYGSPLARFWKITKTDRGIEFQNACGRFIDEGWQMVSHTGRDEEIAAMLALAKAKGWSELRITGSKEFCKRAEAAALGAGFTIERIGRDDARDAEQLAEDIRSRVRQRSRGSVL